MVYLISWYFGINIFCFLLFYIDKRRAVQHQYRISEFMLFFCSFLGGAIGSYLSMKQFHHKTKKLRFQILIPLFLIFHLLILLIIFSNNQYKFPFLFYKN